MQRLISQLRAQRESGATIVTFALFLTIMLGFIGVGVDGAAVFAKRQHVQTAADAAAFALAQEYASTLCDENYALALQYARPNVPNESDSTQIDDVKCGANSVRVTASAEQPPFFLKIVGVGSIRVPASAEVEWGTPIAGQGFPLAFSKCAFVSADAQAGELIEVWAPNEKWNTKDRKDSPCEGVEWPDAGDRDYPPGGFGWMVTAPQPTPPVTPPVCKATFIDAEPGAVWGPGETGNADKTGCDWGAEVGRRVFVPIFSDTEGTGSGAKLRITQFASFELLGVQLHTGGRWEAPGAAPNWCTVKPSWGKWFNTCIHGRFVEYVSIDDAFELGPVVDPKTLVIRLRS